MRDPARGRTILAPPWHRPRERAAGGEDETPREEVDVVLSGPITTPNPLGGSFGITWEVLNRWDDPIRRAADEFDAPAPVMKAMIAIESRGQMFDANGQVIVRDDGFGDGLSVGLLQVKPSIWQPLVPDADPFTPDGNIRLGTAIMASAIRQHGSWPDALTKVFFPSNDPNGTTQNAYVACVQALIEEMGEPDAQVVTDAPDPPEFVRFLAPRVFHVRHDAHATGRRRPHRGSPPIREFGPGAALACDGFFHGEVIEGEGRWLRTDERPHLAVHASAIAEPIP